MKKMYENCEEFFQCEDCGTKVYVKDGIMAKGSKIVKKYHILAQELPADENGYKADTKWFVMTQYSVDTDIITFTTISEAVKEYQSILHHLTTADNATVTVGFGLFNKDTNDVFMDENGDIHADYDSLTESEIQEIIDIIDNNL